MSQGHIALPPLGIPGQAAAVCCFVIPDWQRAS